MHREQRRRLVDCTQCIESSRDCHYGCIDVLETVGRDDENSHFEPQKRCLFVCDGKVDALVCVYYKVREFGTLVLRVKNRDVLSSVVQIWSLGSEASGFCRQDQQHDPNPKPLPVREC